MSAQHGFHIVDNCVTCDLRHDRMFCSLPDDVVRAMEGIKATAVYPKGALLCLEGQPARGVYVLCTGRAKISASSQDGRVIILGIAQPGEVLGLSAVVSGQPYDVTIETLEPTQANFISRADFLKFLEKNPQIGMKVAQQLTHSCQSAYEEIRSLGLSRSVPQKLARLVLHWTENKQLAHRSREGKMQVRVTATQEEIAQMVGSSRETISRTLSQFKRDQLIQVKGSLWTIPDDAALERAAAGA